MYRWHRLSAEGCLEQHKAIVAPEHLLPRKKVGTPNAPRSAASVSRASCRARVAGAARSRWNAALSRLQPAGETRDHPVIDRHAFDEDQLLQQPAARHQRALPVRRQAGQGEPVGIDPERDGFAERDAVVSSPSTWRRIRDSAQSYWPESGWPRNGLPPRRSISAPLAIGFQTKRQPYVASMRSTWLAAR